ncbi:Hypothetical_protein [Hexamita inflata]|uniref:Hypothetical_protein n=1 Tax=Hexamita inflata TaxID=28002 RepID=A0AA86PPK5_9EUKA|nr:Hypothetical protein HINF_LOCUS30026 [Hexamita inflata]
MTRRARKQLHALFNLYSPLFISPWRQLIMAVSTRGRFSEAERLPNRLYQNIQIQLRIHFEIVIASCSMVIQFPPAVPTFNTNLLLICIGLIAKIRQRLVNCVSKYQQILVF